MENDKKFSNLSINNINVSTTMFYVFATIGYLVYTVFGLLLIANQNSRLSCHNMWIYVLVSLLVPFAMVLVQMCTCPFLFTEMKNISYFSFLMTIFGGITIFTCNNISSFWIFAVITFVLQIIVTLLPLIMKLYAFLYNLKTPCCCCDDSIKEENNNLEYETSI